MKNTPISEKEILTAAIVRAIKNGYNFHGNVKSPDDFYISSLNPESGRLALVIRGKNNLEVVYDSYRLIFFEIEFARALFGDDWEKHLDNLAVSSDVFAYLKERII